MLYLNSKSRKVTQSCGSSNKLVTTWSLRPSSTTAAKPAIRCRCGRAFFLLPQLQAFCAALPVRHHSATAAKPAIRCRCSRAFFLLPQLQAFCAASPVLHHSTTAAKPAIRCRCSRAFFLLPYLQAFCAASPVRHHSATAAKPAIRCRCGHLYLWKLRGDGRRTKMVDFRQRYSRKSGKQMRGTCLQSVNSTSRVSL